MVVWRLRHDRSHHHRFMPLLHFTKKYQMTNRPGITQAFR